uniref:Putative ovule protein n=1 Tax=Solanum chacoense TaxID=4108 RepID=A0A0V0IBN2_SOLCH
MQEGTVFQIVCIVLFLSFVTFYYFFTMFGIIHGTSYRFRNKLQLCQQTGKSNSSFFAISTISSH